MVGRARKSHFWLAGAGAIVIFAASQPLNSAVLADSKATPPTIETTLGSDGSAVSTRVLNSNGADTSGISGTAALKTSIAYSLNGQPVNRDQLKGARGPVAMTYKVENTTGKTQDVTFTSADGQPHTQSLLIQVPFVAIVEATVPGSYNNVQAPGGAVSAGSDGNLHVLWSLVLFSPIGSPTQEVTLSAQADSPQGLPGVTVTAKPINPSATEGLSAGTLTANAAVAQNDLFGSYATGADQGLAQLSTGVGQLVAGLTLLHDGSTKLAFGLSNPACDVINNPKNPANPCGAKEGSAALATGLGKIDAGLGQLAGQLPAASAGIAQLQAGVNQIIAGLSNPGCSAAAPHDPANPCGVTQGVAAVSAGLALIQGGLSNPSCVRASPLDPANPCGLNEGLGSIKDGVTLKLLPGVAAEKTGALGVQAGLLGLIPSPGISGAPGSCGPLDCKSFLGLIAAKIGNTADTTPTTLVGGLNLIRGGLSNPACVPASPLNPLNPCGVVQGLDALNAGVGQLQAGLGQIQFGVTNPACNLADPNKVGNPCGITQGLTLLNGGLNNPGCNPANPTNPANPCGVKQGLAALGVGTTAAVNGVNQLHAGSTQALGGANDLANGLPTAVSGSQQIRDGLAQTVAGAQAAGKGASDISTQGTAPLIAKLQDASNNARLELATVDATGARAGGAPLGADATWRYRLDAVVPSGDNNLGRNLLFALGGLLVLLIGGVGGFMFGRRGRVTA